MDSTENIIFAARQHAKRFVIVKEDRKGLHADLPGFRLYKNQLGRYEFHGFNYENHDNAERMAFFEFVLKKFIFPNIEKGLDLSGLYNIELHDSYSYLQNEFDYSNCLTWSKRKDDFKGVLIPDVYHLGGFGQKLGVADSIPWGKKVNKVSFFGTTTGDRRPEHNTRIKTCIWSLGHRNTCDFYITKVAQMAVKDVVQAHPLFEKVYRDPVEPWEVHKYKFNLDIPGNTCSWDRVPLLLNSKTLMFKMPCHDMCFYYPYLQNLLHYVGVSSEQDILQKYNYYMNNQEEAKFMIINANKFVKSYLQQHHAFLYMVSLFEQAAINA